MKYSFHPEAEQEFNQAIDYYEERGVDLGLDFAYEIYLTIQNIVDFPHAWSKLSQNVRRCLTNRYPYGVVYSLEEKEILILAVMHLNRKPSYWQDRLS